MADVFACMHCDRAGLPFVRSPEGKFYRFPPTIGAASTARLLFVGINPRISSTNEGLHESIAHNLRNFSELAANRIDEGAYIGRKSQEPHYQFHLSVVDALCPGEPFESVAAVTELHLCASTSSKGLPYDSSRCTDRYFGLVLRQVTPLVIFAVGSHVERTLSKKFRTTLRGKPLARWPGGQAPIFTLPHPNAYGAKYEPLSRAIEEARAYLTEVEHRKAAPSA